MSICRARLCNTSNALMFRMSGEQIRLQVPPKFFYYYYYYDHDHDDDDDHHHHHSTSSSSSSSSSSSITPTCVDKNVCSFWSRSFLPRYTLPTPNSWSERAPLHLPTNQIQALITEVRNDFTFVGDVGGRGKSHVEKREAGRLFLGGAADADAARLRRGALGMDVRRFHGSSNSGQYPRRFAWPDRALVDFYRTWTTCCRIQSRLNWGTPTDRKDSKNGNCGQR